MFTNIDVYRPTWISTGNEPDFDCFIISKDCYFESNSKKKTPPKVNKQHKKKKKKLVSLEKQCLFGTQDKVFTNGRCVECVLYQFNYH